MQFFYNDIDSKKRDRARRLLERRDYQQLLHFLYMKRGDRVILRDIQKEFGVDAIVQRELDVLVDLEIILRKDRSYSFHVPMITTKELTDLTQRIKRWLGESEQIEIVSQLQSNKKELDKKCSFYFSSYLFVYLLILSFDRKDKAEPFILAKENKEIVQLPKDLSFCYQMRTETFSFESIGEETSWAKYFHDRIHGLPITQPMDKLVFEKIGDVEATFFLDMLGKKIVQIKVKEGFKERRRNLWTEVLIETEELESTENGYSYSLPIYRRSEINGLQEKTIFCESEHLYEKLVKKVQQDFSEELLAVVVLNPLLLEKLLECENRRESAKWLILEKE